MPPLSVFIVFSKRPEGCSVECGIDLSLPEAFQLVTRGVKQRFGDSVKVSLVNLEKVTPVSRELAALVHAKNIALPALIINNQTRISGLFDMRLMLDVIEANLEMEAV